MTDTLPTHPSRHNSPVEEFSDDLGTSRAWLILSRHKAWIIFPTLVGTFVSGVIAYVTPATYKSEALVAPVAMTETRLDGLPGQFGNLAALAGISLPAESGISVAIATLSSRALTESFIEQEHLLPTLFSKKWDAQNQRWQSDHPPSVRDGYELFDDGIRTIAIDKRTGLVTLAIEWTDPKLAASWANELIRRANDKLQHDAIDEGQKTIAYLQEQLGRTRQVEVQQALYQLIESETKRIAVANAREEYAFKIIDPAVPPQKKSRPKRLRIISIGFLFTLLASSTAVLLLRSAPLRYT